MCIEAAEARPWLLECVLDPFKIHGMCNKVVCIDPWLLKYVADWFVVLQEIWYKNYDDEIIEWYKGYKKQKAQKAQIK